MPDNNSNKLLFIVNPFSGGKNKTDWKEKIEDYFSKTQQQFKIFELTGGDNDKSELNQQISAFNPAKVIAVGGDGTVKMVAEELINTDMILGILPAGSANGMATELCIPTDIEKAFDIINSNNIEKIDVLKLNGKNISIHLSDMGLNALLVHYFDEGDQRGMWGYAKVAFKVFLKKRLIRLNVEINGETISRAAYMIALANAKKYGTGAEINPEGNLTDGKFEVIIIRKLSLVQLFKMLVLHKAFSSDCIEIIQTEKAVITSQTKNHFQVDGEYCGKTDNIITEIMPSSLKILIPAAKK
ncbi:MAG: YegS/Rv2252/BmrU family lipid kinase [Parafilimonas sp.]